MARTFELEFRGRVADTTGVRRGFFAAADAGGCSTGDALPPNPAAYTGLRAAPTTSVTLRARRNAPIGVLSGELGARVIGPLIDDARPRRRAGDPRRQRVLRRQHRRHRAADRRRPDPRARRRTRRPPLPAARRLPVRRRPLPRRRHGRRPAPAGRGRRHRRPRPAPGAGDVDERQRDGPPRRRRRRAAERRQEDAVQPHRRRAGGDRRGPPRRHPRPQVAGGRVARRAVPDHRHGRLDARRLRPRSQGQPARSRPPSARPTSCCSSSTVRSA